MLRRSRRALQVLFACAGTLLLLWLPITFFYMATVKMPVGALTSISLLDGAVSLSMMDSNSIIGVDSYDWRFARLPSGRPEVWKRAFWPKTRRFQIPASSGVAWHTNVSVPLIPIVVLLFAWPVTSLLLARQRR